MLQRHAGKKREERLLLLDRYRSYVVKRPPSPAAFFCYLAIARSASGLQVAFFLQIFFAINFAARIALLKQIETARARRNGLTA